jgi:inhibitor of KinA sporulation pathway (predicted exonuclease)
MIVVFDLELTAWPGSAKRNWSGAGEHPEIIQIGAVRLDAELREIAMLDVAVRPMLNPVLSDYITDLTGLTQKRIDTEGIDLGEALSRLAGLVADADVLASNGADVDYIHRNVALAEIENPLADMRFVNLSPHFCRAAGREAHIVSATLPDVFAFSMPGRTHDGLADARAVAEALRRTLPRGGLSALTSLSDRTPTD